MANCPTISIHTSTMLLLSFTLFLLVFTIGGGEPTEPTSGAGGPSDAVPEYLPVGLIEYRPIVGGGDSPVVPLAPFQHCAMCRCCAGGDPTNCSSMPCCYGINCALPNKPFGTCAFQPQKCNCNPCA